MKPSILLLIVISAVITWASISFASISSNTTEAAVQSAQFSFDKNSMTIEVTGRLPNLCAVEPHPVLQPTAQPNTLMLSVEARLAPGMCAQALGGFYQLGFDVRALKFNIANLQLNPNGTYRIVTADKSISLNIDFSKIPFTRPFATNIVSHARISVDQAGHFVVVNNNKTQLVVDSPFINLNNFVGHTVELEGHIINVDRPVYSLTHFSNNDPSLILVTGLSNASN